MIINGIAHWAKVVGPAQPGYDKTQKEWSIDVAINEATKKVLQEAGIGSKVKNKGDDRGDFITFKRKELRSDGTPAKPIEIKNSMGKPWDGKTLIGNGSEVNIKFLVNEVPYNGKVFKKPGILALQVVKLVEYEGGDREDFPEYNEDGAEDWTNS